MSASSAPLFADLVMHVNNIRVTVDVEAVNLVPGNA